ncbi:MAG: PAS domain S-box-containing protein [Verrucomicrobiales bacterium]
MESSPNISPSDRRTRFLAAIDPERHFYRLFDHVSGVLFFAKDTEGRLLAANRQLLRRYGFMREDEILGKTDFDLLARSLAEKFRADDLNVIQTGKPLLEIVELFINRAGIPDWFLTNKRPIFDRDGVVIGVMGTIENYESYRKLAPPDLDLSEALRVIRTNFHRDISIKKLAEDCGMSVRQFERKFRRHLKTSPQQFVMKMRVHAACDKLRMTADPIAQVAIDLGFYDQSSFTRHFRKHMGITPLHYRKTYR